MKKYIRTSNGRFYKVNAEGKKTRIGRESYLKAIKEEKKKRKTSRKTSRKVSRKGKKTSICQQRLQKKIKENMKEFEEGKFANRSQALAVAYSQVAKKYPGCRKYYQR